MPVPLTVMSSLYIIFYLLTILCSTLSLTGVSSGTLVVTQSPDDISVMEGATVNITCCWTVTFGRVGVNWLKNQTVIKNEVKQNQSQGSLKEETKMCSSLNFSNIQTKDSGTYICKVTLEIPSLFEAKGNGTVITVREKTENDNGNSNRKESVLYICTRTMVVHSPMCKCLCTFLKWHKATVEPGLQKLS
uniref:Ig-like domain-containing protein n=1 Tax=Oreochromis aureus TaxID=47969 RepID=A0A668UKP1_OREAU